MWSKNLVNHDNQDNKLVQGFEDYENQSLSCKKNIIIKDRLKEHIRNVNNYSENMNTLHPTGVLPYNLNNSDDYNILNNYGIKYNEKEQLGIMLADGLYNEATKPYFMGRSPEYGLQTDLPYVLHCADHMSCRQERKEWEDSKPFLLTYCHVKKKKY